MTGKIAQLKFTSPQGTYTVIKEPGTVYTDYTLIDRRIETPEPRSVLQFQAGRGYITQYTTEAEIAHLWDCQAHCQELNRCEQKRQIANLVNGQKQ